jgi:hypothetical protein
MLVLDRTEMLRGSHRAVIRCWHWNHQRLRVTRVSGCTQMIGYPGWMIAYLHWPDLRDDLPIAAHRSADDTYISTGLLPADHTVPPILATDLPTLRWGCGG